MGHQSRTTLPGGTKRPPSLEQIERWHALRMMIGFCREEATVLGAEFLVYCMDLGIEAADDHMRRLDGGPSMPV